MLRKIYALVFCLLAVSLPALADEGLSEINGDPVDSRTRRAWAGNYAQFAQYCFSFEDDWVAVPGYSRRMFSSRGVSASQAREEMTQRWRETSGAITQRRARQPEPEEVEVYIKALPDLDMGTYGYIDSVEILEILGPDQMLVRNIWLIDKDQVAQAYRADQREAEEDGARDARAQLAQRYEQRLELIERQEESEYEQAFRLVGYTTRGLRAGDRYNGSDDEGMQVAVIKRELPPVDENARRRRRAVPRLVLIAVAGPMRTTLDEQAFIRMIDARGYTIASFVQIVRELRSEDRDEADERIFNLLMPPEPEEDE